MAGNDPELARLKAQMDEAQRDIDRAKARLDYGRPGMDGIKSQLEATKARIADLKRSIAREKEAMHICYQAHDRLSLQDHRYAADSFRRALDEQYALKESYHQQLSSQRGERQAARAELDAAKARKQRAREAFQARLATLRAQSSERAAQWREKPCAICGGTVRYNVGWEHVPNICKPCKDRKAAERAARKRW